MLRDRHMDCKNFRDLNNWCALKEIQVDPYGPACDQFQPKVGVPQL